MPREARLDYPGALHHVVARGVARGKIFGDDDDKRAFLGRMGELFRKSKTVCYAWSLMPNHFHLLLRTGADPLWRVMQKLLTWYAIRYNHKYRRVGHFFQNRYKAILCEEELYLLELVRYIHLNPLRAGMVEDLDGLRGYSWCGHRVILGGKTDGWQDVAFVLGLFDANKRKALEKYTDHIAEGIETVEKGDVSGGGLIRSAGGLEGLMAMIRNGDRIHGDSRILGSGEFVSSVIGKVEKRDRRRDGLGRRWNPEEVVKKAAVVVGVGRQEMMGRSRRSKVAEARALACKWLVEDIGMKGVSAARLMGITKSAVSKCITRGREVEAKLSVSLGDPAS